MKKLLAGLLLLLTLAAVVVACADGGTDGGDTTAGATDPVTTTPVTEEGEPLDETLYGWFEKGSALVYRDTFTVKDTATAAVYMAKNEKQGFQYILASGIDHEDLRCEVSDLTDGQGNTLRGEVYVAWNVGLRKTYSSYERGYVPFALLPQDDSYQGGSFDVTANRSKTLYVEYETTADTVPGVYTGTLEIKKGGEVVLTGEVSLTVWDIYYDEATAIRTVFGYGFSPMHPDNPAYVPVPEGAPPVRADNGLTIPYADFLLEYRHSISALPSGGTLLDEEAEKYLDNPRVTDVCLSNTYKLEEQYQRAVERGWVDKIYFLQFDEPHEELHVKTILNGARNIAQRFPTTRHMNPLLGWNYYEGDRNIVDVLSDVTTLHCVKSSFYTKDIKASLDRLKAERGDTIFWYTCGDQPYNMIDLLPCVPGNAKETLFWQLYQSNIDGYLCWSTTWWYHQDNIWEEGYEDQKIKFPAYGVGPTGMGVSVYWHPETNMPVPTLTLTSTCDGIEDYQLIAMADAVLGRDVVLPLVEKITTSPTSFTKDADLLEQVRIEIAEALLAAKAQ